MENKKAKLAIEQILRPLFFLSFSLEKDVDNALKEAFQLSMAHFKIILYIKSHPGKKQSEIASFWGVTEASISRQIDMLSKKKYISKKRDKNNLKSNLIVLTEVGENMVKKAKKLINNLLEKIFLPINQKDREQFLNQLNKFQKILCKKNEK